MYEGFDFNQKVVWITGASSGIGEALASYDDIATAPEDLFEGDDVRVALTARVHHALEHVAGLRLHRREVLLHAAALVHDGGLGG